jgi:transcriptional regulator with XRE-family HTH domain
MRLRNNIFAAAFDYLKREKGIKTQKRLAELMGVSEDTITRILKDRCEVTEDIITKLQTASGCIFNLQWLRGEDSTHMLIEDMVNEPPAPQPEIPDFIQKLFDEAVRMQTRNELLERQCEKLIGELREAKSDNDTFIEELRKSKEFNDTLAAELKISRTQNENLITELRETRKELQTAINGIETMKNQMAMMMTTPQPSPTFPLSVNDDGSIQFVIHDVIGHDGKSKKKSVDQLYALVPQGLIRGGRPGVTDEIVKQAVEAFKKKK